jgi:pimeloyl-ACP methyl ester carboxylesterase
MSKAPVTLTEKWTILNGLPMLYRVATDAAPAGATPIVHIHGFGISGRYLVPAAERLAPFHPTYVPDLPGYGRSHKPERTLTIPQLAESLRAFLDTVGIEKPILLGNSMGCLISIEFAHAFPDRIERAILVSPAGGPHNQPIYRGLPQLAQDALRETPRMATIAVPDYVRFGMISSLRLFHAMTNYPTVERALELEIPLLVVAGARDPLVSQERLRKFVAMKPQLTLVIHNRAAHAINYSHPQELADIVHTWLEDRPLSVEGAGPDEVVIVGGSDTPQASEAPQLDGLETEG